MAGAAGVVSVEELIHEDLVSEYGVSVMSVVGGFDELSDFCLCLDSGGEVVFGGNTRFHGNENDLNHSVVLSPSPVLLWMAYYGGSLI